MTDHRPLDYIKSMAQGMKGSGPGSTATAHYEIEISGELDSRWSQWFSDVEIAFERLDNGLVLTKISCRSLDQAKLRGMLNKIWDLNLELVSVRRLPDLTMAAPLRGGE
jgi:hypothetical protein